jgi:hypothetical protein
MGARTDQEHTMSNWAQNLGECLEVVAVCERYKVQAPQFDAHITAWYAFKDAEFQRQWAKRPRRRARPFNKA